MTAWVVCPVHNDLSSAQHFGEIKYVSDQYVFPNHLEDEQMPRELRARMEQIAAGWDVQEDALVLVGDDLQRMQLCAILAHYHERFRVLRWDRILRAYLPVWVLT